MKLPVKSLLFLAALSVITAESAFADSKIEGDVDISVETGDVISAAIGNESSSEVSIGSVRNSEVGGDVTIDVKTGDVISAAIGNETTSRVSIGSVE